MTDSSGDTVSGFADFHMTALIPFLQKSPLYAMLHTQISNK